MGFSGEDTDISPSGRPGASMGNTYQLLLRPLQLLNPIGLPTQADILAWATV